MLCLMIGIVGITSAEAPCLESMMKTVLGTSTYVEVQQQPVHFEDQYNEIIDITKLY